MQVGPAFLCTAISTRASWCRKSCLAFSVAPLNLPHGMNNQKVAKMKTKKQKTDMLRSTDKQSGESVESGGRLRQEGFAEQEGFKPGLKE